MINMYYDRVVDGVYIPNGIPENFVKYYKPYFNDFSPFQINANLLNISGLILWQCSKIFSK